MPSTPTWEPGRPGIGGAGRPTTTSRRRFRHEAAPFVAGQVLEEQVGSWRRLVAVGRTGASAPPSEQEFSRVGLHAVLRVRWRKIWANNPLERLIKEVKRRSDVVGIFRNDRAAIRLIGAVLADQHDEWAIARRYLSETSMAERDAPRDTHTQQPAIAG